MNYMKYVWQVGVIMLVSFIGEMLNKMLPLPVPGSVYGLVLMLILLISGIVKLEMVEETASFLIKVMPLMFIGPGVSLMTILGDVMDQIVPFVLVALISTVVVMVITGLTAQFLLNMKAKKEGHR